MGGLLAKQILRTASAPGQPRYEKLVQATRAVMFVATPHQGSVLATVADALRVVFGPTLSMEDLKAHDAHLRDLYNWYRGHAAEHQVETVTYYETLPVMGVTVVNAGSSQAGVGQNAIPLDEDHLSIAKPTAPTAQICLAAVELVRESLLKPRIPVHTPAASASSGVPVPMELPPPAEKFFGRTAELAALTQRLRERKNTAVVGPAGFGKTALAADALRSVVGETRESLAHSPYPDGVVFLDLYTLRGSADAAWDALATRVAGPDFLSRSLARQRAAEACKGRRLLLVIEGGEEADGSAGRAEVQEILTVLPGESRWLLLTRLSTQSSAVETVTLKETLDEPDAGRLLDALTKGRVEPKLRDRALVLLEGHPLALTWAGDLLAREEDDPEQLISDWEKAGLPPLSDPHNNRHTLRWLYDRSVRGLQPVEVRALEAAGLLAHAPFPLAAMQAALAAADEAEVREVLRALVRRNLLRWVRGEKDHWQFAHVLGYLNSRKESGADAGMRTRLGQWLHAHLKTVLFAEAGQATVPRSLEHMAALLRTDDDQLLWQPLAEDALYDFRERLTDLGQLALVGASLGAFEEWMKLFPEDEAGEPRWARERAALGSMRGNVRLAQGDLAGALAAHTDALGVAQRLAEADPANVGRQRDLSVSLEKIGDVLLTQGDGAGALGAYTEALGVRRRLAEADPKNPVWQRDVSISRSKIGDVRLEQGDLAGALGAYTESLGVTRRLAEVDLKNEGRQLDLGVSLEKIGDVRLAQKDMAGALGAYTEALGVLRRLAEADPTNAGWQQVLSGSIERIGDVRLAQGDLAEALGAYTEALGVRRRLAEADPTNTGWQRDLSLSLTKIAVLHLRGVGSREEAVRMAEESLRIDEKLAALDPTNATWREDVEVSRRLVARLRG